MLSSLYFLYLSLHTNFLKFTLYLFIRTWTTCLLSFGSKYGADLNYTLHRSGPKKSCRVYFFSSDKSTDLICLVAIDNTTWYLQFHLVQFTRNYTQTVKRAADNKRRYAPGEGSIPPVLLSGVSKGVPPLAHDFACKV